MKHEKYSKEGFRKTLKVIYFADPNWGFTDAALPKFQRRLTELADFDYTMTHSSLVIRLYDEQIDEAERVKLMLQDLTNDRDFQGFGIGESEGIILNFHDIGKIHNDAVKDLRNNTKSHRS